MENGLGRVDNRKSGEAWNGFGPPSPGGRQEKAGDIQGGCFSALLLHLSNPGGGSGSWLGAWVLQADVGSALSN